MNYSRAVDYLFLLRDMKEFEGFNPMTDTYEDLVTAGVIDPAKVVRSALQNASSIALLLLTTEALTCDLPEKKDAPRAAALATWAAEWEACTKTPPDGEMAACVGG